MIIASSTSATNFEQAQKTVTVAGTYLVRVEAVASAENAYDVNVGVRCQ